MEGQSEIIGSSSEDRLSPLITARQGLIDLKDFPPGILKTRIESLAILTEVTIDDPEKQRRAQYGNFALGIAKLSELEYNTDAGRVAFGYFYRKMNLIESDLILKTASNKDEEQITKLTELHKEMRDSPPTSSNAIVAKIMELNTQAAYAYGGGITFAQELEDNYRLGEELLEPMPEDAYKAGAITLMQGSLKAINEQAKAYFQK